jgi:CheY-like chemotaxis protein
LKNILVVDDEPAICELLAAVFSDEGYKVLTAKDGREAWLRMVESHPDLVVSDIMIPFISGEELCKQMMADPQLRSIPLILMSAAAQHKATDACPGAVFIHKPFDLNTLLPLVQELLENTRNAAKPLLK